MPKKVPPAFQPTPKPPLDPTHLHHMRRLKGFRGPERWLAAAILQLYQAANRLDGDQITMGKLQDILESVVVGELQPAVERLENAVMVATSWPSDADRDMLTTMAEYNTWAGAVSRCVKKLFQASHSHMPLGWKLDDKPPLGPHPYESRTQGKTMAGDRFEVLTPQVKPADPDYREVAEVLDLEAELRDHAGGGARHANLPTLPPPSFEDWDRLLDACFQLVTSPKGFVPLDIQARDWANDLGLMAKIVTKYRAPVEGTNAGDVVGWAVAVQKSFTGLLLACESIFGPDSLEGSELSSADVLLGLERLYEVAAMEIDLAHGPDEVLRFMEKGALDRVQEMDAEITRLQTLVADQNLSIQANGRNILELVKERDMARYDSQARINELIATNNQLRDKVERVEGRLRVEYRDKERLVGDYEERGRLLAEARGKVEFMEEEAKAQDCTLALVREEKAALERERDSALDREKAEKAAACELAVELDKVRGLLNSYKIGHRGQQLVVDAVLKEKADLEAKLAQVEKEAAAALEEQKRERLDDFNELERLTTLRPFEEYHKDMGPVLWWETPVDEPPYAGTPSDRNWPFRAVMKSKLCWLPIANVVGQEG